jgi:hypothetical protein
MIERANGERERFNRKGAKIAKMEKRGRILEQLACIILMIGAFP